MASGSLKALLAVLAVAGYQNRDKIGELIKRATEGGGLPQPNGGGAEDAARPSGSTTFPDAGSLGSGSSSADPFGAGSPGSGSGVSGQSSAGQSMSGLDDLLGSLIGGLGGGSSGNGGLGGGLGGGPGGGLGGGGLGGLGGLLGGAGLGTLLNGGLTDLIDQFRQAGQSGKADSWVGAGANEPIEDSELQEALGPDVLRDVAEKTGLSEAEVLARLAKSLPDAVDGLTPSGLMPPSRSGY